MHNCKRTTEAIKAKANPRFRAGKELNGDVILDGKWVLRVTLPKGGGDLTPGTEASIRRQLLLGRDQFDDLVRCPMTGTQYLDLLRSKRALGII